MFTQTDSKPNPAPMWKAVGRLQQCFARGQRACALGAPFGRSGQAVGRWQIWPPSRCRVRGRWRRGALKISSVHLVHVSAHFLVQYKELAENVSWIPPTCPSSDCSLFVRWGVEPTALNTEESFPVPSGSDSAPCSLCLLPLIHMMALGRWPRRKRRNVRSALPRRQKGICQYLSAL